MERIWLTAILLGALVLLFGRIVRYELTALLIIVALMVSGLVEPHEAVRGFSSKATVTVAALCILGAGMTRTGLLSVFVSRVADWSRGESWRLMLMLALVIPVASAFVSNTAVVVLFIPVLLTLSRRVGEPASKFLMPVSFYAMLGGTLTLLGTSTNLLVDDLFRKGGGAGFGVFEFSSLGAIYLVVGAVYILAFAGRLLPDHDVVSGSLDPEARKEYVTEIMIGERSEFVGQKVDAMIAQHPRLQVLELVRDEDVYWPPFGDLEVRAGDLFFVRTDPQLIYQAVAKKSFALAPELSAQADQVRGVEARLAEVVVLPGSAFVGVRLHDVEFHRRWGVTVLAIQRRGQHLRGKIGNVRLQVGDMLLVQGTDETLRRLGDRPADFVVIDELHGTIFNRSRMPLALVIMAAVVLLASLGFHLEIVAMTGAAAMIVTGCLRIDDAFRALDSSVLMLLAGTIPLGVAMQETGLAADLAGWVLASVEGLGPAVLVAVIFGLTSLLTTFLSHYAPCVLMTPIALSTAATLGVDPTPLVVAVAFGGSACFLSPIGHPTNTLVLGPGGYRFADYVRFGLPLNLILWALASWLIPVLWPV